MLDKIYVFLICFLLTGFHPMHSQSVNVKTKRGPDFTELQYNFLTKQFTGDSILIMLNVKDRLGDFVGGLAKPQKQHEFFTALLDTSQREICKDFTVIEATIDNSPIRCNFSLVLDYSKSMEAVCSSMQEAADKFVLSMPEAYFSLVNFDERPVAIISEPILKPTRLPSKDNFFHYGGGTALIAATDKGIETLKNAPGVRFVMLFTDGQDNDSGSVPGKHANTASDLVDKAKSANTSIYALGVNIGNQSVISEICSSTGGKYFPIDSKDRVKSAFDSVRTANFTNFYIIQARCKETPVSMLLSKPYGDFRKIIAIPIDPTLKDTFAFAAGYGCIQFEYSNTNIIEGHKKYIPAITELIYKDLKANPNLEIQIQGHASPDGDDGYNTKLSESRALSIQKLVIEIIERKCGKCPEITKRVKTKGFGRNKPLYTDKSNPRYSENRRVEIQALQQKKI